MALLPPATFCRREAANERWQLEEAALAERAQLHQERQQLEHRLHEEGERAQNAIEAAERIRREGVLTRLFNQALSRDPPAPEPSMAPRPSAVSPPPGAAGTSNRLSVALRKSPGANGAPHVGWDEQP